MAGGSWLAVWLLVGAGDANSLALIRREKERKRHQRKHAVLDSIVWQAYGIVCGREK